MNTPFKSARKKRMQKFFIFHFPFCHQQQFCVCFLHVCVCPTRSTHNYASSASLSACLSAFFFIKCQCNKTKQKERKSIDTMRVNVFQTIYIARHGDRLFTINSHLIHPVVVVAFVVNYLTEMRGKHADASGKDLEASAHN